MSGMTLCNACQQFLHGLSKPEAFYEQNPTRFSHHLTAHSFKQALDLICSICQRLWMELSRKAGVRIEYSTHKTLQIGPTCYSPWTYSPDQGHAKFTFECNDVRAYLVLEPVQLNSKHVTGTLTTSTGAERALGFLVAQYENCRDRHLLCRPIKPQYHPTRVIDVGTMGAMFVRLRDGSEFGDGNSYAVLSHCWGSRQPLTLTAHTAAQMKEGISLASLPKTFQDAIAVTRNVGIQYIWIDSICIYQDNLDDWSVEAARMRDVYSNAAVCIAATSAKNGKAGLLFDREPENFFPVIIEIFWNAVKSQTRFPPPGVYRCGFYWNTSYPAVDAAPLNQRAWVAQERYLSSRIMHFTKDVLFWECHESLVNEAFPHGLPDFKYEVQKYAGDARTLKRLTGQYRALGRGGSAAKMGTIAPSSHHSSTFQEIYLAWTDFRTLYTTYNMTKDSDILVALLGVAQDVAEATSDQFVAGLWKQHMLADLCWMVSGKSGKKASQSQRPLSWRAPTWSWASTTFQIYPSTIFYGKDLVDERGLADVLDIRTTARRSGHSEKDSLLLECCLMSATFNAYASDVKGLRRKVDFTNTPKAKRYAGTQLELFLDDFDLSAAEGRTCHVYIVAIRTYRAVDGNANGYLDGLALLPCKDVDEDYSYSLSTEFPSETLSTENPYDAVPEPPRKRKRLWRALGFNPKEPPSVDSADRKTTTKTTKQCRPDRYRRIGAVLGSTPNSIAIALQRHQEAERRVIEIV